ncbi:MAG: hypothetical protein WCC84_06715 [Candidatus Cybelea sp.]
MPLFRSILIPALLGLVAVLFAANLITNASAQTQNAKPLRQESYIVQVQNDVRNNTPFRTAPGYKLISVIPCSGAAGPYGQGTYLCTIEKQEQDHDR